MYLEQKQRPLGRPRQNKNTKSTKEIILEVATRLFLTQNYQVVSMDEVAKECGVTKATVYYYYSTKADLFTATMIQMMVRIRENMDQILSTNKNLEERLLDFATVYLHATMDIDMKNFMKDAKLSLSAEQLKELKNAEDNMYEVLEKSIANAMHIGEIPKGNPKFAAHAFVTLLSMGNFTDENRNSILASIDELAQEIVSFYWNGLGHSY
ncbi:TetR family transcriptional regulator [Bacillus cereus]|uniref:TetR family transcriptional regulator n=1 Tax=Bacillus cereus TaxID=1396 RepID=A0A2A8U0U3_BACCE|nr:TetR family transcriptional regulator [Bacillus cereus]PFA10625.1 TetR family transcriptional regulator [Bacillus cereus]PFM41245.1 TetR family transcriptional regulator [Bacillus cereus]PGL64887.1 TetR family transcriptional regulator [Bacillus cereus]PGQ09058.1 TetR family transcriptional regulator [Bacillus cereus]